VTPEEVAAAAAYLTDTIGKDGIKELISNLSKAEVCLTMTSQFWSQQHMTIFLFLCLQKERFLWKTSCSSSQTEQNNEEEEEEGAPR
jgi:hypothetical protein